MKAHQINRCSGCGLAWHALRGVKIMAHLKTRIFGGQQRGAAKKHRKKRRPSPENGESEEVSS